MKRGVYLAVLGALVLGAVIVTPAGAQVYPVRLDQERLAPESAAPTPPSLVLADGGLEFPDGSVQTTAAGGEPPALVPRTGQTTCYDADGNVVACGTGIGLAQDGDLQLGVNWPNPRFTENGDGTVTDNLTGLIWLDDADCFGTEIWTNALAKANALFDGCADCGGTNNDCGLADGSLAGQWRLPNVREQQTLVHYGVYSPAVPDTVGTGQWSEGDPFSGVSSTYWSSTSEAERTGDGWFVSIDSGNVRSGNKADVRGVWPVRGGQ